MSDSRAEQDADGFKQRNASLLKRWLRERTVANGMNVLDVGAGGGGLDDAFRHTLPGARVVCVEPSDLLRQALAARGYETYRSIHEISPGLLFDFVVAIEVVEHVPDPVALLTEMRRATSSNGALFLTTPCGQRRNGRPGPNAFEQPEHVQFFTESSLARAFREAGWPSPTYRFIPQLYPPGAGVAGWFKRSGRRLLRPVLDALFGPSHLVTLVRYAG